MNVSYAEFYRSFLRFAHYPPSDNDQVTLAPGLVIDKQGVGVARVAIGFQSWDGILGFVFDLFDQALIDGFYLQKCGSDWPDSWNSYS